MKIVGLTGGIGSGKTTVAGFFADLGVPVYIADTEAKRLTNTSKIIRRKLIALLGSNAYNEEGLNRKWVAQTIFKDAELLEQVNQIIHPKVGQHFKRWVKKQKTPYCIKEAAVLFENGGYKQCDYTILVTAPLEIRLQRVMARDAVKVSEIKERMSHQWEDEKKLLLADFHIENVDLEQTKSEVNRLHQYFLKN